MSDKIKPENWNSLSTGEKLKWLSDGQVSDWLRQADWRIKNHWWLWKYNRLKLWVYRKFGFWLPKLHIAPKWYKRNLTTKK